LTALSRFISRLAERALPFFKLLQKSGPFVWTNDAEEAFQELKRYLTSPPVMVAPEPGEPLLLYIAATSEAVRMVLVAEWLDPHGLHELGSSSSNGSGSQDLRRSRELSRQPGPSPRRPPRAPPDQAVTGSPVLELPPCAKGRELPGPAPMEMDASDPSGGPGPSNVRYTTSARSSMKPRRGIWRSTSCFMQSSSLPGSYATTSRLT
jgi:hypothetical protein